MRGAASDSAAPDSYTPKHLAEKIFTSKTALEGERKQVTILFADLTGSMELLADRDPEEARKILDSVLAVMLGAGHPDTVRFDTALQRPATAMLLKEGVEGGHDL